MSEHDFDNDFFDTEGAQRCTPAVMASNCSEQYFEVHKYNAREMCPIIKSLMFRDVGFYFVFFLLMFFC